VQCAGQSYGSTVSQTTVVDRDYSKNDILLACELVEYTPLFAHYFGKSREGAFAWIFNLSCGYSPSSVLCNLWLSWRKVAFLNVY